MEKGMSQGDICRATGMDRGYISRVEGGSNLEKIVYPVGPRNDSFGAKALGVAPDELLK